MKTFSICVSVLFLSTIECFPQNIGERFYQRRYIPDSQGSNSNTEDTSNRAMIDYQSMLPRGWFTSQSHSKYNLGGAIVGKEAARAEAESSLFGSKATVRSFNGEGEAQSHTQHNSQCEGCNPNEEKGESSSHYRNRNRQPGRNPQRTELSSQDRGQENPIQTSGHGKQPFSNSEDEKISNVNPESSQEYPSSYYPDNYNNENNQNHFNENDHNRFDQPGRVSSTPTNQFDDSNDKNIPEELKVSSGTKNPNHENPSSRNYENPNYNSNRGENARKPNVPERNFGISSPKRPKQPLNENKESVNSGKKPSSGPVELFPEKFSPWSPHENQHDIIKDPILSGHEFGNQNGPRKQINQNSDIPNNFDRDTPLSQSHKHTNSNGPRKQTYHNPNTPNSFESDTSSPEIENGEPDTYTPDNSNHKFPTKSTNIDGFDSRGKNVPGHGDIQKSYTPNKPNPVDGEYYRPGTKDINSRKEVPYPTEKHSSQKGVIANPPNNLYQPQNGQFHGNNMASNKHRFPQPTPTGPQNKNHYDDTPISSDHKNLNNGQKIDSSRPGNVITNQFPGQRESYDYNPSQRPTQFNAGDRTANPKHARPYVMNGQTISKSSPNYKPKEETGSETPIKINLPSVDDKKQDDKGKEYPPSQISTTGNRMNYGQPPSVPVQNSDDTITPGTNQRQPERYDNRRVLSPGFPSQIPSEGEKNNDKDNSGFRAKYPLNNRYQPHTEGGIIYPSEIYATNNKKPVPPAYRNRNQENSKTAGSVNNFSPYPNIDSRNRYNYDAKGPDDQEHNNANGNLRPHGSQETEYEPSEYGEHKPIMTPKDPYALQPNTNNGNTPLYYSNNPKSNSYGGVKNRPPINEWSHPDVPANRNVNSYSTSKNVFEPKNGNSFDSNSPDREPSAKAPTYSKTKTESAENKDPNLPISKNVDPTKYENRRPDDVKGYTTNNYFEPNNNNFDQETPYDERGPSFDNEHSDRSHPDGENTVWYEDDVASKRPTEITHPIQTYPIGNRDGPNTQENYPYEDYENNEDKRRNQPNANDNINTNVQFPDNISGSNPADSNSQGFEIPETNGEPTNTDLDDTVGEDFNSNTGPHTNLDTDLPLIGNNNRGDVPNMGSGIENDDMLKTRTDEYGNPLEDEKNDAKKFSQSVEDSQAVANITRINNETVANSFSYGRNEQGEAGVFVSGSFSGHGSFSAQANVFDNGKEAQSQVFGSWKDVLSSARGKGGNSLSQAKVQLESTSGLIKTDGHTDGLEQKTDSIMEGSYQGGEADARADGVRTANSETHMGVTPANLKAIDPNAGPDPFFGSGAAAARGNPVTGFSRTHLNGNFRHGISYGGKARAEAGTGKRFTRIPPRTRKFNRKNINVNNEFNEETPELARNYRSEDLKGDETESYNTSSNFSGGTEMLMQRSDHVVIDSKLPKEEKKQSTLVLPLLHEGYVGEALTPPRKPDIDLDKVYEAGEEVPGTNGYRIPAGFRGKVKPITELNSHMLGTRVDGDVARVINTSPNNYPQSGKFEGSKTTRTANKPCGYLTYHCYMVYGPNGRTKTCTPMAITTEDGVEC